MKRAWGTLPVILAALAVGLAARSPEAPGTVVGTVRVDGARPDGAVIYLEPVDGSPARDPGRTVVDQRRLRFVPEVVTVAPGTEVAFHNSDPLLHNIFSPEADEPFDLGTYPEGEARSHRFETAGAHVILCNIHPEMEAWVFVTPAPYTTVVDGDGAFRIEAPAGRYRLGAWHRRGDAPERIIEIRDGRATRVDLRLSRPAAR